MKLNGFHSQNFQKLESERKCNKDLEAVLKRREEKLKKIEAMFDRHVQQVELLNQKLGKLKLEIDECQDDVVRNPDLLVGDLETSKKQVRTHSK